MTSPRFSYVADDITDRKRDEQAVLEARDDLELRVRARTQELEDARADLPRANRQLQHDAFHDALTGLPNRALFADRLGRSLERVKRRPEIGYAVLFFDLDHFKVVNDSLGHEVGDQLLVAVGRAWSACIRETDTLARLGGDEFTLLLEDCTLARAAEVIERLQGALAAPFELRGRELFRVGEYRRGAFTPRLHPPRRGDPRRRHRYVPRQGRGAGSLRRLRRDDARSGRPALRSGFGVGPWSRAPRVQGLLSAYRQLSGRADSSVSRRSYAGNIRSGGCSRPPTLFRSLKKRG